MGGCTVSLSPASVTCCKRCATKAGDPVRVYYSAASDCATFLIGTPLSPPPLAEDRGMIRHLKLLPYLECCDEVSCDETGLCPVYGAVLVGSGRDIPACFTGRRVTPSPSVPSPTLWNRDNRKESRSVSSTGLSTSSMSGVTFCMNAHPCWSYFCITAYAVYGCRRATSDSVRTNATPSYTFSSNHVAFDTWSLMNPPR